MGTQDDDDDDGVIDRAPLPLGDGRRAHDGLSLQSVPPVHPGQLLLAQVLEDPALAQSPATVFAVAVFAAALVGRRQVPRQQCVQLLPRVRVDQARIHLVDDDIGHCVQAKPADIH